MNLAPSQPNRQIELRPWREADLPLMMQLRNDVALQAQLLATARGSDMAAVRAWLARRGSGADRVFLVIAEPATDAAMGYLQTEAEQGQPGTWRFGICLNGPFQGAGRGSAALVALERLLSRDFNARRLILDVDRDNDVAIRCYRRLGYDALGEASRQVLVCGELRDVVGMAKTIGNSETSP